MPTRAFLVLTFRTAETTDLMASTGTHSSTPSRIVVCLSYIRRKRATGRPVASTSSSDPRRTADRREGPCGSPITTACLEVKRRGPRRSRSPWPVQHRRRGMAVVASKLVCIWSDPPPRTHPPEPAARLSHHGRYPVCLAVFRGTQPREGGLLSAGPWTNVGRSSRSGSVKLGKHEHSSILPFRRCPVGRNPDESDIQWFWRAIHEHATATAELKSYLRSGVTIGSQFGAMQEQVRKTGMEMHLAAEAVGAGSAHPPVF
jgi:hypothetical protein